MEVDKAGKHIGVLVMLTKKVADFEVHRGTGNQIVSTYVCLKTEINSIKGSNLQRENARFGYYFFKSDNTYIKTLFVFLLCIFIYSLSDNRKLRSGE